MSFGINLVGPVSANIGLGLTARSFAEALRGHGVPLAVFDVALPWGERADQPGLAPVMVERPDQLPHPVNLYVLPVPVFESLTLFRSLASLFAEGRLHVASIWWEASHLPPGWSENLSRLDAVLAGSPFIAAVLSAQLELTPVIDAPHPLSLPSQVAPDRARFGLPEDSTVFTLSLDPNSDPARKNPFGAVAAFKAAFPSGSEHVRLVIRLNNAASDYGQATAELLRHAAGGDARVKLLLDAMEYEDVLALYASSDVYVSLHRGEGLGLGLMEAMALGKPVIATAWSGNMSFMDYACGCLVRYRLIPVVGNRPFLRPPVIGPHALWADPQLDDAVQWMRRLHDDPPLRERIGAAARQRIEAYQAEAGSRRWIDQLDGLWRAQDIVRPVRGKFSGMSAPPAAPAAVQPTAGAAPPRPR